MTDPPADTNGPQRITQTLVAALCALSAAPDGLSAAQLAKTARLIPNTALVLLRRMEGWGTVAGRWTEPETGRPVRLYTLTEAGKALADQHAAPAAQGSGTC